MFSKIEYNIDVVLHGLKEEQKREIFQGNMDKYIENEKLIQHLQMIVNHTHPFLESYRDSFNEAVSI